MKLAHMLLVALFLLPAGRVLASDPAREGVWDTSNCCDEPVRWASRHDTEDAALAITTEDGDVTLLVTDRVVAFQLSDRTLQKLRRKLRQAEDEDDDNVIGTAIKAVVMSTVRTLLAHSAECPVREIRSVKLSDGRLEFVGEDGKLVFEHLEINDRDEMAGFTTRDAQAFIQEFRKVKARVR